MRAYVIRRLIVNIPVIWAVVTLVFFATSVLPGDFVANRIAANNPTSDDPAAQQRQIEAIRRELGLDKPVAERYVRYLGDLAVGDFGDSYQSRQPALQAFKDGLPHTLHMAIGALLVAVVTSVPIGVISAIRQDSWADYVLRVFAILGLAAPNFWVATVALLLVVRYSLWTVPITPDPLIWNDPVGTIKLFAIPWLVGGIASGAGIMRLLRSQMLEVLRQDYIRTAWSKGLEERVVVIRHAMKNALIPVVTVLGLTIAGLLSGNVIFEQIFAVPGVGFRILGAVNARDMPVLQAFVIIIATFIVFVNLGVDLLYGLLDPRIRLG